MLELGFLLALGVLVTLAQIHEPVYVKLQWDFINYTWPSEEAYDKAKDDESYIERNNVISGIKVYKDRMYLTIPRWRSGVPVTLASISISRINGETEPFLEPFPNWDMQKVGDCRALQFVQNVEIDPKGRMWVLDSGRVMSDSGKFKCPPRLVILNLEDNGAVLRDYPLPAEVADSRTAYLYDIVLEHEDGGVAYISDADAKKPGIIVFSLQNGTFWKMSHHSTKASRYAIGFRVDTVDITSAFNIHGLALSPASFEGNRTLYYCPLSSYHMFSISTNVLKKEALRADVNSHVRLIGKKPSQTDGMIMSNTGVMYFGLLNDDAVSMWNTSNPSFVTDQRIIVRDHRLMQWPASFAFDNNGSFWYITNRLHLFLNDSISIKEPNFRAIASKVRYTNYQYLPNGSAPHLPKITAGAGSFSSHESLTLANLLVLVLLYITL